MKIKEIEKYSSCCGAGVYEDMLICKECKEHCSVEEVEELDADKLKQSVDLDIQRELNPAN